MAEEEDNPGIGCPTVSEAVLATFWIHEPHVGQGSYIEWHQVIVVAYTGSASTPLRSSTAESTKSRVRGSWVAMSTVTSE